MSSATTTQARRLAASLHQCIDWFMASLRHRRLPLAVGLHSGHSTSPSLTLPDCCVPSAAMGRTSCGPRSPTLEVFLPSLATRVLPLCYTQHHLTNHCYHVSKSIITSFIHSYLRDGDPSPISIRNKQNIY